MAEVIQYVAATFRILPLLFEKRLGMHVTQYLRSSYMLGIEGHKWNSILDKVVPIGIGNYLEEIERHWIHHTDNFTMRNI